MANSLSVADVLIRWREEGLKDVQSRTANLGKTLDSIGSKAKIAGAALSVGLTAPLVLMGKQAIDAASDLNEATSAVTTVFGKSADEMIRFSQTAATRLGQSQRSALSAASALGALFEGVGLNNAQMAEFSKNVLQASADLGSFFNVDPTEALGRIRSGLVGEAEGLRQFGILLSADAVEAKALELGLVGLNDELSEGVKVQARYALIMDQLGAAQGDFARTSDGLANSQRILAAQLQDVRAEIGTYLLPYALRLSQAVSDLLGWFRGLDEGAKRLAVGLGAAAAAAGPALIIFGQLATSAAKIGPILAALTGPLGFVALGVGALALAWKNDWFNIRELTSNAVSAIGETLGRMVQFFQAARERGLDPFTLGLRTLIVGLKERLGRDHPVVDFLREVLNLGHRLGRAFETRNIEEFVRVLGQARRRLGNWLGEQVDDAKTFGASLLQNALDSMRGLNWDVITGEMRKGLNDSASRTQLFNEPDWQAMWADLWRNTQNEFAALQSIDTWTRDNILKVETTGSRAILATRGKELAESLWQNTLDELTQLSNIGKWVATEFGKTDWGEASLAFVAAGEARIGELLQGMGDKMRDVQNWISGGANKEGGTSQGLGDRLWTTISGAFAKTRDKLIETGKAPFGWLLEGMQAKWAEIETWLDGLTVDLPLIGGGRSGPATGGTPAPSRGGKHQNEEQFTRGAMGTVGRGNWALVGEAGPELVKLPTGSMVIPHGASMARLQGAVSQLAAGGVAGKGWINWFNNLSDAERRRRAMRGINRELPPGWQFAEDYSVVPIGYYGGSAGSRPPRERNTERTRTRDRDIERTQERDRDRTRRRDLTTPAPTATDTERNRDRREQASSRITTDRPLGSRRNPYDREGFQDYMRQIRAENAQAAIPAYTFYGPVNIYPATADLGYEISRQLREDGR